jgi:hypothetical protein
LEQAGKVLSSLVNKIGPAVQPAPPPADDSHWKKIFDKKIVRGAYLATGTLEFAAGDGMRIGFRSDQVDLEPECRFAPNLPETIPHRESGLDGRPEKKRWPDWDFKLTEWPDWNFELIDDNAPAWVGYKGLWGRLVNMEGEKGPRGPRWEAEMVFPSGDEVEGDDIRMRWGGRDLERKYQLEWLDLLLLDMSVDERYPPSARRKAVQSLAE